MRSLDRLLHGLKARLETIEVDLQAHEARQSSDLVTCVQESMRSVLCPRDFACLINNNVI